MRLELNGPETCEPASHGGFVQVKVPIRVVGGNAKTTAIVRYRIDQFAGREVDWPLRPASDTRIVFRIPGEVFRDRAKLRLEVMESGLEGDETTLWTKTYLVHWSGGTPSLEELPEHLERHP